MNRPNVKQILAKLRSQFEILQEQRYFKDKLSLSMLLPTLMLNIATLVIMLLKVRPTDFAVPVRYASLGGFDQLGPWYSIYRIGLFAVAVTVINTVLAVISFRSSRITSFILGAGSFVVALFCLIIGVAFTVIL